MARSNERCIEHTPKELNLDNHLVGPRCVITSRGEDVQGAKIHVYFVKVNLNGHTPGPDEPSPNLECEVDYVMRSGEVVQTTPRVKMEPGKYTRVQFGTYGAFQLPSVILRLRVFNGTDYSASVRGWGVSQLQ